MPPNPFRVRVDKAKAVIRAVLVCSTGKSRDHETEIDRVTLDQVQACAEAKGRVPVRVHRDSRKDAECGHLANFRQHGECLVADWHLQKEHPLAGQILKIAERMPPRGVGLSTAFLSEDTESCKARCVELLSVDFMALPKANPDGLFETIPPEHRDLFDRAGRVIDSGRTAAEIAGIAAGTGFVARQLMKTKRLPKITSPKFKKGLASAVTKASIAGGVAGAAYRIHRDKVDEARRFERQTVREILFTDKPAIRRVTEATADEIQKRTELPGGDYVQAAKNRRVRSILWKGSKIAAGATLGHLAGKKIGARAGLIGGAVAGALLARNFQSMNDNSNTHRRLNQLVERESAPIRAGKSETHTLATLARRLLCTEEQAQDLVSSGVLTPLGPVHRDREDGPISYNSDDLNAVTKAILRAVADRVVESSDGDADSMVSAVGQALRKHRLDHEEPSPGDAHLKEFSRRVSANGGMMLLDRPEEERPSPFRKAAGVAAVGAGLYAGASALRGAKTGRSILDAAVAGHRANLGTLRKIGAAARPGLSAATKKVLRVVGIKVA